MLIHKRPIAAVVASIMTAVLFVLANLLFTGVI
jgi:hypothetical protein